MACYLCQRNIKEIEYKDKVLLSRFVSSLGKIRSRKKSGLCALHQRQTAKAIKRARSMGLFPYTSKPILK